MSLDMPAFLSSTAVCPPGSTKAIREHGSNQPPDGEYNATRLPHAIADKSFILNSFDDPDIAVLDVRTPAEYSGLDRRAARGGHIPGTINMDWTLTMDQARNLRVKPENELREMLQSWGSHPRARSRRNP